jgi:prophage DNA circulation protein
MATRTEKLLPASFKGISFLVRTESKSNDGRQLVFHLYPNSDDRYVEDLGKPPADFTIEAFVTGEDWQNRATQLREALNEEGSGRLVLPTFGVFTAFASKFSENATQKNVGEISFSINFSIGNNAVAPSLSTADSQEVFDSGDNAREKLTSDFETLWIVPTENSNVQVAQFDVLTAVNSIEQTVSNALTDTADFIRAKAAILDDIPTLIRTPQRLAQSFFSFVDDVAGIYMSVSTDLEGSINSLTSVNKLIQFGSDLSLSLVDIKSSKPENDTVSFSGTGIPFWEATTGTRIIRNSNRKAFVQSIRLASLIVAYEQAAAIEYTTKNEVQTARSLIEQSYNDTIAKQAYDVESIYNQADSKDALITVRNNSLSVLDQKEQQAFELTTLSRQMPISSYILSYQLYAESFQDISELEERRKLIRALNPLQGSANFSDDFDVFQAREVTI